MDVRAQLSASVWQVKVEPGQRVGLGEVLVILQLEVEQGARRVVGVNCHVDRGESVEAEPFVVDPAIEAGQVARLQRRRADATRPA